MNRFKTIIVIVFAIQLVVSSKLWADNQDNIYQVTPQLVDPDATSETRALYDFLRLQFRHRIISGQTHSYYNSLASVAGKSPMLRAGDFQHFTEGYAYLWKDGGHTFGKHDDGSVDQLISWYNQTGGKGIVSYQWHWHSPSGGEPGTNTFYTDLTTFDIARAITPGTAEYNDVIRDMDDIATELKRFRDAGIPVLWRPLHEAGGRWFWWGAGGAETCKELYNMMFDRFMNHHGLHNLIWVWSTPETAWYPGNEKVDIIGHDSYPGSYNYANQKDAFDHLLELTNGEKLIAMTENGPIPDPDECLQQGAPWLYFMSWSDLVTGQNSTDHILEVFDHPGVLSVESGIPRTDPRWRSSLYPEEWKPGFKDMQGRFLHDFSHAGYHDGNKPVPHVTGPTVDVTAPPYLADHTGIEDVTQILQQALDDVGSSGGGVVFLPAGTYRIRLPAGANNCLTISHSHTVLRGAGPESTFLYHDEPQMRFKNIIYVRGEYSGWFTPRGETSHLRADLSAPTRILPVEDIAGYQVGDQVIVTSTPTEAFMAEHGMQGIWTPEAIKGVAFKRTIDSIDASRKLLILDTPTRYPLKTRDQARIYHAGSHLMEIGIENLSIGNLEHPGTGWEEESYTSAENGAYDVHFSQAIKFEHSENCWVKNVHTYRPSANLLDIHLLSNGIHLNQCRHITIDSCDFQKPQYEGGGGNGYMYTLVSNDCLIRNSRANHSRHNYDFKYPFSNGNVIHNCRGEHSKYSSDFHMYLSMANLFDQCTVNGDYLESMFRPWGGSAIHGYPTTQSVFYNTVGEGYHTNKNYIIDSRQFRWGYVIGTSGPAYRIVAEPVSGTQGGYSYDTSPRDFVEGVGEGTHLDPPSLYLDQLDRRKQDSTRMNMYDVEVEVVDSETGEKLPGCEVAIYDNKQTTDGAGKTLFTDVPEMLIMEARMEHHLPIEKEVFIIISDTLITIKLDRVSYHVSVILLDSITHDPFKWVRISMGDFNDVTDDQGVARFSVPAGNVSYAFQTRSFRPEAGVIEVFADTVVTFYLVRTHAKLEIWLKEGTAPVNKVRVWIGGDTITTTGLGLAVFNTLSIHNYYTFGAAKTGYQNHEETVYLTTDTSIQVVMQRIPVGDTRVKHTYWIRCWPNPVSRSLYFSFPPEMGPVPFRIKDTLGRTMYVHDFHSPEIQVNVEQFPPGIYVLVPADKSNFVPLTFVKYQQ